MVLACNLKVDVVNLLFYNPQISVDMKL